MPRPSIATGKITRYRVVNLFGFIDTSRLVSEVYVPSLVIELHVAMQVSFVAKSPGAAAIHQYEGIRFLQAIDPGRSREVLVVVAGLAVCLVVSVAFICCVLLW